MYNARYIICFNFVDQMQLTNTGRSSVIVDGMVYPNSHKLLPPTPTYMTEVYEEELQDSSEYSVDSKVRY